MNQLIFVYLLVIGFIIGISAIFYFGQEWKDAEVKAEAQKIIDFRNVEHSCTELKRLYLEYYYKKYNSMINVNWYNEIRDRLVDDGCVNYTQLNNIEVIEICKDGGTTGCEISKLQYPEAYENFNFRTAIKALKPTNGSES